MLYWLLLLKVEFDLMDRISHIVTKIILSVCDRSMLRKSAYKIKYFFVIGLIKCSLYLHSPKFTALIFTMIAGKINTSGENVVLCIGRTIFLDDVKAMAKFSRRIKYIVVFKNFFGIIFYHFTEEPERKRITEQNYHTHNYGGAGKKKYNQYLKQLLPQLQKLLGFDAILSGNFGYVVQEEIARVCVEIGIPFIVLHKEAFDAYRDLISKYGGCKFIGAKMLVYNDGIKKAFLNSGVNVSGLTNNNIEVVGAPRLDYYFLIRGKKDIDRQIVFFSFYPDDYFSFSTDNDEVKIKQARTRADDFHKWVMNFALHYPDIKVIIKTKFANQYVQYVKNILRNNFDRSLHNLTITNAANPFELIRDSMAVVGYSSMVLVEAIITNRIVVSPYFEDLIPDNLGNFFQKYPELVKFVQTEKQFEEYILNFNEHIAYGSRSKRVFLEELISTPDGQASIRAENAIINVINEFKDEKYTFV